MFFPISKFQGTTVLIMFVGIAVVSNFNFFALNSGEGGQVMANITSAPANEWAGATTYNIGDEVSSHLVADGAGRNFLRRHLNGERPRLADFGCWTGRNLSVLLDLAKPYGQVYGVDGSWAKDAVQVVRQKTPTVRVVEASLSSLPFPNGNFSGALCWRVLHNQTNPGALAETLREFHRVLRPHSPLVVAVRAALPKWGESDCVPVLRRTGTREDLYFSRPALESTFGTAGFAVQHAELILEGEEVDGHAVMNRYWAVHLLRESDPSRV